MSARLKDVAHAADVSTAAVSAVLRGRPSSIGVSVRTRERILAAARALGYRQNPIAVALSTGKTQTIGVLAQDLVTILSHPDGAFLLAAMHKSASERGYRLTFLDWRLNAPVDPRLMDGCLLWGRIGESGWRQVAEVARQIPVLTTSTDEHIPGTIRVPLKVERAARVQLYHKAAEYLFGLGHRDVAVVEYTTDPRSHAAPHFRRMAKTLGLKVRIRALQDLWDDPEHPTVEVLSAMIPLPTAAFVFDDVYARTLIDRLTRRGVRVPDDVSVFSGETRARKFDVPPALTGIDAHYETRYAEIIGKFIDVIQSGRRVCSLETSAIALDLVERGTCARPRSV